jgi:nuclease HARBI1
MTPLRNPIGPAQLRYNRRQLRTRNIIERTFGIWKKRFPCLAMTLQYEPLIVGKIVVACAVLHNLAIEANEPLDYEPDPVLLEEVIFPDNGPGNACRNTLIQTYFT